MTKGSEKIIAYNLKDMGVALQYFFLKSLCMN